jgi:hypothetical protein
LLDVQDTSNILKVLAAADELCLQELVDYLQNYLIENKSEWMEKNFEYTQRISLKSNNLLRLQQFCIDIITKSPEKLFNSLDFTSLSEESLVQVIKRDDLQMREVEIWEHVLKWGIAQNPTLISDPNTWSDDDFKVIENTLQNCLPLIRFFSLSSKEFLQKVDPYKKLFKNKFYKDLLNSYMDPDIEPTENISLPRNIHIDGIIDTKIVNLNIVSIISRWIDKVDVNNKFAYLRELYLPYKFQLLLRGSRDGFTPKNFHTLCDGKPYTVTFIKLKDSEEILGGYNPLKWESSNSFGITKDNFIFSFKNKNNFFKNTNISYAKIMDATIAYYHKTGPCFGGDIKIYSEDELTNYSHTYYGQNHYEKKITDCSELTIEDYEVFRIFKK